jgi:hypothetical protein
MMDRAVKLGLAMLAACVAGLLLVGSAGAQSIGVAPGIVEIDDAARGAEYMRLVTLINHSEGEVTFEVAREGEAAQWASLHPANDQSATLESIVVAAGGSARVLLRVAVPSDAANGVEEGVISFKTVVTDYGPAGEARARVSTGVVVHLEVNVSGTQSLSGTVLDVYTDDVEVGDPLVIKTNFQNTGNVKAKPEIALQMKDSAGAAVGEASYGDTAVGPGQTQTIESEWDTSGKELGEYVADVAVSLEGNQIHTQEVGFEIVAEGTLRGQGVLEKLTLENSPEPGGVAEIAAHFQNTSHSETRAAFVAEIYLEDQLLDAVTTPEQLVEPDEVVTIEASLDVPNAGEYTVRGNVSFEGRRTEAKELSFRVGGSDYWLPIWAWILVGCAVIVVVVSLSWALRQRWVRKRTG